VFSAGFKVLTTVTTNSRNSFLSFKGGGSPPTFRRKIILLIYEFYWYVMRNTDKSLLFRKIIDVDHENDTKHINAMLTHNSPDRVQTTGYKTTREFTTYSMITS
jgi:hypothetical protein